MRLEIISSVVVAITTIAVYIPVSVYGQLQSGNSTVDALGNSTIDTSGISSQTYTFMNEFFKFTEICDQFLTLGVTEEFDKCLEVYKEYNQNMNQLRSNHSEVINKNMNISLKVEEESRPEPIRITPYDGDEPGSFCREFPDDIQCM